jgi:hypothetical protein
MKHLKTYENVIKTPKVDDWVVAYRPFDHYDNENDIVISHTGMESVFDIGIILNNRLIDDTYYTVIFPNAGKNYVRVKEHIIFVSNKREDAEEYLATIKATNKYNI